MKWTRNKPVEPGWYWCRSANEPWRSRDKPWVVCMAFENQHEKPHGEITGILDHHMKDGVREPEEMFDGSFEFFGPIPEPRNVREKLADYAHRSWSQWMVYMFGMGTHNEDGSITLPARSVQRWERQMHTVYSDLPEDEKNSDRNEADNIIHICQGKEQTARPGALCPEDWIDEEGDFEFRGNYPMKTEGGDK